MTNKPRLSEELKLARGDKGLRAFARKIGISHSTLARLEKGEIPNVKTIATICARLGFDPAEMLLEWNTKKPKPRLKIRIVDFEKALAVQILEMDERFRAEKSLMYKSKNGFKIMSEFSPTLSDLRATERSKKFKGVFLRGYRGSCDYDIPMLRFPSNQERDTYKAQLIEALNDWKVNYEGWKSEGYCREMTKEGDIYVF